MAMLAARFPHLKAYMSSGARAPDALNFEQLLGFLYAVSSAPDIVDVSEWLHFIFGGENASAFESHAEAERVTLEAMDLYHAINCQVFECKVELPPDCRPRADALANLDPDCGLSRWAQGFSLGHDWLEDAWEASVQDEFDENLDWQLGGCMAVLCFFSSAEMAQALHAEFRTGARSLEERARVMLDLLPEALNAYADIGRCLAAGCTDDDEPNAQPAVEQDAFMLCACGSGRLHGQCCGASRAVH